MKMGELLVRARLFTIYLCRQLQTSTKFVLSMSEIMIQ